MLQSPQSMVEPKRMVTSSGDKEKEGKFILNVGVSFDAVCLYQVQVAREQVNDVTFIDNQRSPSGGFPKKTRMVTNPCPRLLMHVWISASLSRPNHVLSIKNSSTARL
jgi:hypothetical protein